MADFAAEFVLFVIFGLLFALIILSVVTRMERQMHHKRDEE